MPTKTGRGGKRPFTRTIPEPLETWLPKARKGTPKVNGQDLYNKSISMNAFYEFRHYAIKLNSAPSDSKVISSGNWGLEKYGVIERLTREEYTRTVNILRQTIGQAGYRTILSVLGGAAVRNAILVQFPYDCHEIAWKGLVGLAKLDATRNFSHPQRLGWYEEVIYGG